MYEHHSERLLPLPRFARRVVLHMLAAFALLGASLGLGIAGYHITEGLSWLDALLNASMILGGMGPVDPVTTTSGKLFASFYALFSGLIVLAGAGIIVAPVAHRILPRLHVREEQV